VFYRPTIAEIDLGAYEHNLARIRESIGADRKLMAVVKANAYGHGAVPLAKRAVGTHADWLGVATIEEAIELRSAEVLAPILILGPLFDNNFSVIIENDIRPVLISLEMAEAFDREAKRLGKKAKAHVMLDTGMGRIGFWQDIAEKVVLRIAEMPNVEVEGVMTHYPESDGMDKTFTQAQTKRFGEIRDNLQSAGLEIPLFHAGNSGAILDHPDSLFDMVRAGIITYGIYPSDECSRNLDLRPVMTLRTKIAYLKTISSGRSISYGRTYIAQSERMIATLPIGYADGIPRYLSNRGIVVVRDENVPIVGRVTMDQIMIDVTDIVGVQVGDDVLFFGQMGRNVVHAEDFAALAGTIGYEVVCWVSKRVPRIYK
jgi:alanine racemase